jgi:hypothetical protein
MIVRWCVGVKANGSWFQGDRNDNQDQKGKDQQRETWAIKWSGIQVADGLEPDMPSGGSESELLPAVRASYRFLPSTLSHAYDPPRPSHPSPRYATRTVLGGT